MGNLGTLHPKVVGSAMAGAIVVILLYVVKVTTKVDVPPEVAAAVTTVIGFIIGYLVPSPTLPAGQVVALSQRQAGQ